MYYEKLKEMLTKKEAAGFSGKSPVQAEESRRRFSLSCISLRHYLGKLTPDALLLGTFVCRNPIFYAPDPDRITEQVVAGCVKVNEMMRAAYGEFDNIFDPEEAYAPVREFMTWGALFPEKRDELYELAFHSGKNGGEDEDEYVESEEIEYLFAFTTFGCAMGDMLPLPAMIHALNSSMFLELMEEGETRLASLLISE